MKKLYTIKEIIDTLKPSTGRRIVKVTVQVKEIPEKNDEERRTYNIELGYPAYGESHYAASIDYLEKIKGRLLDHKATTDISGLIRGLWYEDKT